MNINEFTMAVAPTVHNLFPDYFLSSVVNRGAGALMCLVYEKTIKIGRLNLKLLHQPNIQYENNRFYASILFSSTPDSSEDITVLGFYAPSMDQLCEAIRKLKENYEEALLS